MYGEINIPCKIDIPWGDSVDAVITGVCRAMTGDPIDFRVIIDGNVENPEFITINGTRLLNYNHYQLHEWYKSYLIYQEKQKTEYFFEENGDEYWYQMNDFNKHYTRIEG